MGQGFLEAPVETWFSQAKLILEFVIVLWVIAIVDMGFLNHGLLNAVIQKPRTLGGLFYYPFLAGLFHVDWDHITSNTFYALLFGGLIVLRDPTQLWMVTIVTSILSGLGIWVIGRGPGCGASGIIFGYLGFIVAGAALSKDLPSAITIAWLLFTFLFGSRIFYHGDWQKSGNTALINRIVWSAGKTFWGVVPGENPLISWEAHLLGFLSGIFAAYYKNILTPWVNLFIRWVQGS